MSAIRAGYKQTEVGVIPEDWDIKQIQEVCGFIVPGRNKPRSFDGTIPWITTPDLEDGRTVSESRAQLKISPAEAKSVGSKIVPKGSVVMSCVGELGIVALTGCDIVINQQLHAFLPSEKIVGSFLAHTIKTRKGYIDSVATKTALPYLNKDNCNSIPIPVPSIAEQEAIAEALSDADALIESLEQLLAKKRHLKQGAMQELLTGKKRLPGFSGEWREKKLGNIAPLQRGFDLPTPQLRQGTYPVVYSNGVLNTHAEFQVEGPGVVTGRSGTIGKVSYVEQNYWPHNTTLWVTSFKGNDPKFAFYLLTSIGLEQFATGSGVPTLNRNDVHDYMVNIPPSANEQAAIATVLSDVDDEIAELESQLAKTRALKQGMMQKLLTGEIRLI